MLAEGLVRTEATESGLGVLWKHTSWPKMSPAFMPGMELRYRCRSEPQMAVEVTFKITSSCRQRSLYVLNTVSSRRDRYSYTAGM